VPIEVNPGKAEIRECTSNITIEMAVIPIFKISLIDYSREIVLRKSSFIE